MSIIHTDYIIILILCMSKGILLKFNGCNPSILVPMGIVLLILLFVIFSSTQEGMEDQYDDKIDMDDYIRKSSIVPPVCPACPSVTIDSRDKPCPTCPSVTTASRDKPCPPCPACERCPESSFECKKVPTYSHNNSYIPVPVLNDFSGFGM
jgi:hypothetical protein